MMQKLCVVYGTFSPKPTVKSDSYEMLHTFHSHVPPQAV